MKEVWPKPIVILSIYCPHAFHMSISRSAQLFEICYTFPELLNKDTSIMQWVNHLKRLFLAGLFVVVPAWGTFLILQTLFVALDNGIRNLLKPAGIADWPGLGIVSLLFLIMITGVIVTQFVGQRILSWTEEQLDQIPIVRSVYLTLKGMTDVLNFRSRFGQTTVVLFPFPRQGLWALGFVMGIAPPNLQISQGTTFAMVFVPTAIHPFTGYLAFLPQNKIIPINLPPEEAMKIEFSAGLYRPPTQWLKMAEPR